MSTFLKQKVGSPIVLCGGFFLGLLEALLGKPGTLHSLGQIFASALGVPPDLRGASAPGGSLEVHGRVEGVGCILADPVGRVCLSYKAGKIPGTIVVGDLLLARLPLVLPVCCFRPRRGLCWYFVAAALRSGGGEPV